jgi:hypothetical protein
MLEKPLRLMILRFEKRSIMKSDTVTFVNVLHYNTTNSAFWRKIFYIATTRPRLAGTFIPSYLLQKIGFQVCFIKFKSQINRDFIALTAK